jgi:flagella basal body P-ring formation protein FlgA
MTMAAGTRRHAIHPPLMTRRSLRIWIALAVIAFLLALANRVWAEPIEAIVRAKLAPALPDGLAIAKIYWPAELAHVNTDPARVVVELPRELRAGRPSIKLTVRGHRPAWIPVAIAQVTEVAVAQRALANGDIITDDDLAFERRAIAETAPAAPATVAGASVINAIGAGTVIAARDISRPPPLARGTQVAIDVRRGAVHVRGTGVLETAARPGELASAKLTATKLVVHGRLVAPATLIVGD